MLSQQQRAEIARRNGARSRGPKTEAGKRRSCRSALRHGRRAAKLAEFLPPDSAILSNEDRQRFFTLFDQNLAKYRPRDAAEKAVVREITDAQWTNHRIAQVRADRLNRELAIHNGDMTIAYAAAFESKSMAALRYEANANTRLVAQAERRLRQMQSVWPAQAPAEMTSANERSKPEPTQPVEKTEEATESHIQRIRYSGPLTPDVIKKYRKLFPNKDLAFLDEAGIPAM